MPVWFQELVNINNKNITSSPEHKKHEALLLFLIKKQTLWEA
jgi:hypothetical protein